DPGHDLRIGPHVGRGDVLVGADEVVDLLDEPPSEPFELLLRQLAGIAIDSALAAAEGDIDNRGFPGHEAGERPRLVLVDVWVIAQATLIRPTRVVMLNPITDEIPELARVELNRDLDPQL